MAKEEDDELTMEELWSAMSLNRAQALQQAALNDGVLWNQNAMPPHRRFVNKEELTELLKYWRGRKKKNEQRARELAEEQAIEDLKDTSQFN